MDGHPCGRDLHREYGASDMINRNTCGVLRDEARRGGFDRATHDRLTMAKACLPPYFEGSVE